MHYIRLPKLGDHLGSIVFHLFSPSTAVPKTTWLFCTTQSHYSIDFLKEVFYPPHPLVKALKERDTASNFIYLKEVNLWQNLWIVFLPQSKKNLGIEPHCFSAAAAAAEAAAAKLWPSLTREIQKGSQLFFLRWTSDWLKLESELDSASSGSFSPLTFKSWGSSAKSTKSTLNKKMKKGKMNLVGGRKLERKELWKRNKERKRQ